MATKKKTLQKAVFLDRDGVINEDVKHLKDKTELRILPGVAKAIRRLNDAGYRVLVVTNQGAIAKRMTTPALVESVHVELRRRLSKSGAVIDGIYYCPHHPGGTIKEYSIVCRCRKPGAGMIKKAARDLGIDIEKSFLVGDKTSDILAGHRAGLTTILVKTGYGGTDMRYKIEPDFIVKDLLSAVNHFLP